MFPLSAGAALSAAVATLLPLSGPAAGSNIVSPASTLYSRGITGTSDADAGPYNFIMILIQSNYTDPGK